MEKVEYILAILLYFHIAMLLNYYITVLLCDYMTILPYISSRSSHAGEESWTGNKLGEERDII